MSKRDVVDERMAQRFAWRTSEPEDAPVQEPKQDSAPPPQAAPPADDPEALQANRQRWKRARQVAAALAKDIALAWQMTALPPQAVATATLLQRANRIGAEVFLLDAHPMESLHLWRLVVRHRRRLPSRARKEHVFALVCLAPPLSEREMADLLVEVATSGDLTLTTIMTSCLKRAGDAWRHPEIGTRLARLVAEGKTWTAREAAAQWLHAADVDVAAAQALRRALRQPRLVLRTCALNLLLAPTPPALQQDDVLFLLDDAIKHPPPRAREGSDEPAKHYADALFLAVAKVAPNEGWRPLQRMADTPEPIRFEREHTIGVDEVWALRALAAAYPLHALGRIDRRLLRWRIPYESDTLADVALLPPEHARPRLLDAAARPNYRLAEQARRIWFDRFGHACPVDPLHGMAVELLVEPPSERFFACLAVLRGPSTAARDKMMEALLSETPAGEQPPESLSVAQRETLVLLLCGAREWYHPNPVLPSDAQAWTAALRPRFGPPAFAGLAMLAEQDARAGLDQEFFSALNNLAGKNALTAGERDRLCDIARVGLKSPLWDGAAAPLHALLDIGAPADLLDCLWSILTAPEDPSDPYGNHYHAAYWTIKVLVKMRDAPELDSRIAGALVQARQARAWTLFERLATAGCGRGVTAVFDEIRDAITGFDGDPAASDAIVQAGRELGEAGAIDNEWLLGVLRRPALPGFGIAARLVYKEASLAILDALEHALAVSDRDGAAAAEAAAALFAIGALGAEDRRFDGILERAPAHARASFAERLIWHKAPLPLFQRHFIDLLASPEDGVAKPVLRALQHCEPEGMAALLEDALPLVSHLEILAAMEEALGEPTEAETYWQGAPDEADAEDAAGEPT